MNLAKDCLTFTVPLTLEAHKTAQEFYQRHSHPLKAKQVYLNTLAVYAVNFYLNCLDIETDLEKSDSWYPVMQSLSNTANLIVKNQGKLECCPVLPEVDVCYVPAEVLEDRIGYIAVKLNQSLTEATLLGFLPTESVQKFSNNRESLENLEIPLHEFQSLKDLLEHLSQTPILLRQWLQNLFNQGWETMETLFNPPQPELAYGFRTITAIPKTPVLGVRRGKLLELGRVGKVALCVALEPSTESEMDISVEVYPTGGQIDLPQDLQLMVLDAKGEIVMHAQARSTKSIQLKFSAELGESFGVRLALGEFSVTEAFLI